MRLPLLDTALWAAGPLLNAALLCVIVLRRRLRTFPMLASWCMLTIVSAAVLFFTYRLASDHTSSTRSSIGSLKGWTLFFRSALLLKWPTSSFVPTRLQIEEYGLRL